jgi:F-type H+-transporting ATPase subunit a
VVVLIVVIVRFSTWRLKEVPTGAQNVMETLVEGWESMTESVLEPKVARWVFPYAATFFIFIFVSNLMDLLPGVGSVGFGTPNKSSYLPFAVEHVDKPLFRPPTSDANLTVAMAAIYFVMSTFWALRYNGPIGLLKHIFGVKVKAGKWFFVPLLLLFIFIGLSEMISIVIVRPVALAMRLYGNILGGESLLTMTLTHKPLIWGILSALPFYFFELLVCFLQAFVFAMLTIAFVGTLCMHMSEEDNGH